MPWPRSVVGLVLLFLLAVGSLLSCAGPPDEAIPIIDAATSAVEGGLTAAAAWKAMARHSSVAPYYSLRPAINHTLFTTVTHTVYS